MSATPTIIDDLLPINKYSRPGTPCNPTHIVVHWTGNPGASAKANRDYFANYCPANETYASAQYLVGIQGEILRCVPENEVAYHAGGRQYTEYAIKEFNSYPHNKCVGIEVCPPDITGKFTEVTLSSLALLIVDIMKRHNIPVENVIRHYDVTGKVCPKYFVEHEDEWQNFKKSLSMIG